MLKRLVSPGCIRGRFCQPLWSTSVFILKTPELAPHCPHYSSPEPQPVSVTQPGGPITAPSLSSFPSRSLLGDLSPSFRGVTIPSQATKGSHWLSTPSASQAACGPQLFSAPQHLCLPFLCFRAWQRPPSPEVFSALNRPNEECSQMLAENFYFSPALLKQASKDRRGERGVWGRAIVRKIISSYREDRPPPPALFHFAYSIKPSMWALTLYIPYYTLLYYPCTTQTTLYSTVPTLWFPVKKKGLPPFPMTIITETLA